MEKVKHSVDHSGSNLPPKITIQSTALADSIRDNHQVISIINHWAQPVVEPSRQLVFLLPGDYTISKPSSTIAELQLKEHSLFGNCADMDALQRALGNTIKIDNKPVTVTISGRRTVYTQFQVVIYNLDPTIKTPQQLSRIIPQAMKNYWKNIKQETLISK